MFVLVKLVVSRLIDLIFEDTTLDDVILDDTKLVFNKLETVAETRLAFVEFRLVISPLVEFRFVE